MKQEKPLRVMCVVPGDPDNPRSLPFVRRQIDSLQRQGIEAKAFFLRSRISIVELFRDWRRFRKESKAFRPDVVHAQFGTVTAMFCALVKRKPLVITFRGSDLNPAPGDPWLRNKVSHLFSHLATLRADRIICVSQQLQERLRFGRRCASVIPNGINCDLFRPSPQSDAREKLGWKQDQPVALFNVRTDPIGKRLDLAEGAVEVAREQFPNLRLYSIKNNVMPDEMPLYYNAADCLLMTSDYEGSPNVVKEAIACNLPVVSVDVGDVNERLDGVSPSHVVDRTPDALGTAVVDVLQKRERSNGTEVIAAIAEERIAESIVEVYHQAARRTDFTATSENEDGQLRRNAA